MARTRTGYLLVLATLLFLASAAWADDSNSVPINQPDFVVSSISAVTPVGEGGIYFTGYFDNVGTIQFTGLWQNNFEIYTSENQFVVRQTVPVEGVLIPGNSPLSTGRQFDNLALGNYYVKVTADSTNSVSESNENNNDLTRPFSVGGTSTSCVYGNYQCSGAFVQKCSEQGQWFNAQYCENGCQNGQCVIPSQQIIELNQAFGLSKGQTGLYQNEHVSVYLAGTETIYCITTPCPSPVAIINISRSVPGDQTGSGTQIRLAAGEQQNVFGLNLKAIEVGDQRAKLILTKPSTGDDAFRISLGDWFKLPQKKTALIISNNETLSKLNLVGVTVHNDCPIVYPTQGQPEVSVTSSCQTQANGTVNCISPPTPTPKPCGNTIANFLVSDASLGTHQFSLQVGSNKQIGSLNYELKDVFVDYEQNGDAISIRHTAVMRVTKEYGGNTVNARMDVPFKVQVNDRVNVSGGNLNFKVLKMNEETVVIEASPQYYLSQSGLKKTSGFAARFEESSGSNTAPQAPTVSTVSTTPAYDHGSRIFYIYKEKPANVYGYTVKVNWINGPQISTLVPPYPGSFTAELVVSKGDESNLIRAKLDEVFKLQSNDSAVVLDNGSEVLRVRLLGLSQSKCFEDAYEKCEARVVAKVELSSVPNCKINNENTGTDAGINENAACAGVGTVEVMRSGESILFAGLKVHLAYADNQTAAFIVSKSDGQNYMKVYLDHKFSIKNGQTALVVDAGVLVKLSGLNGPIADISVFSQKDPQGWNAITGRLKPGQSISAYGYRVHYVEIDNGSARLLVTQEPTGTQNVLLGEKFKLQTGNTANILNANLQVELLNVQQSTCNSSQDPEKCLKQPLIARLAIHQKYFIENDASPSPLTGQVTGNENYKGFTQEIQNALVPTAVQESIDETVPQVYEIVELFAGEKKVVNGYIISALDLWSNGGVFLVEKESSEQRFAININKGWNLFSIPPMKVISSSCDTQKFRIFEYENGEFKKVKEPKGLRGYWLYNKGDACEVKAVYTNGESFKDLLPLQPKWNFAPVIGGMFGKTPMDLGCDLQAAFLFENGEWTNAKDRKFSIKDLGKAFVAYSNAQCQLGQQEPEPQIPAFPGFPLIDVSGASG